MTTFTARREEREKTVLAGVLFKLIIAKKIMIINKKIKLCLIILMDKPDIKLANQIPESGYHYMGRENS